MLADDHTVVRTALRMLLEAEPEFEVVAEAGDAPNAVRYVRGHKPTVLILDLNMPGQPSLEAIPDIKEASPETRVVVLTMQAETAFVRQALQAGVAGYVLKEAADAELVEAVRSAATGNTYVQPALGARLAAEPEGDGDDLSERETEVLRKIALGFTNAEIAEQLFLSVRTVESHRAHIQQKLGLSTRSELVGYALDHGLVETGALDDRARLAGNWKLGPDFGPLPWGRGDVDAAADQLEAFPHSDEPEPFGCGGRIEADAVVSHRDRNRVSIHGHLQVDPLCTRMLDDIGQRLLNQPVEGALELGIEPLSAPCLREREVSLDVESRCRRAALGQSLDRRHQAELVQGRGPKLGDQGAKLVDLATELVGRLSQSPLTSPPGCQRRRADPSRTRSAPRP